MSSKRTFAIRCLRPYLAAVTLGGFIASLLLSFPLPAFAAQVSADSLAGYWKFDETSAGSFTDSSGDGNTGTGNGATGTNNTPQPSTDVPSGMGFSDGRSLSFDGTDDYVDVPDSSSQRPANLTIATWMKTTQSTSGRMICKPNIAASTQAYCLGMNLISAGKLTFSSDGLSIAHTTSVTGGLNGGTWHHVAASYDGSNVRIYLDGLLDKTQAVTGGISYTNNLNLQIGRFDSSGERYNGSLDDVRIYNRALAPWEISELAAGRHVPAYWNGTASTGFENKSNWSGSYIPDPYSRIEARFRGSQPLTVTGAISAAGLTIATGAALNMNGQSFTMKDAGTFTNYGTLQLKGTETLTSLTNSTDKGTVLVYGTGSLSSLPTGLSYYNLNLNDGLVGYWKLDETSGTRAADASGYGNSGSLLNGAAIATTVAPTNFNNPRSVSFDGTNDYVSVAHSSSLALTGNISVCFWLKPGTVGGTKFIMAKDSTSGWAGALPLIFYSNVGDANSLKFYRGNSSNSEGGVQTNTSFAVGNWYHTCFTTVGTTYTAYVNGVSDAQATFSTTPIDSGNPLVFGRRSLVSDSYANGILDDIRIYNRALSPAEIAALAAGNQPSTAKATITLNGALDVTKDLILNGGTLDVSTSNYAVTIGGSLLNNGGKFVARQGTVTFDGTSAGLEILTGGQRFHHLTLNGAGATWNTRNRLTATGTLTLSNGTLDASGSYVIRAGTVNQTSGTFTPRAGSLILTSAADATATIASTLNALRIEDSTENGLIGYWKFDEGTNSGSIIDSAGSNTGVRRGGAGKIWSGSSLPSLQFDNAFAMQFDGTDDRISNFGRLISPVGSRTICLWAAFDDATAVDGMIGTRSAGGSDGFGFRLSGPNTLLYYHTGGSNLSASTTITASTWYHLCVTLDTASSTAKIYKNGAEVSSAGSFSTENSSSFNGIIGDEGDFGGALNGKLDDVRIYNRALSANEVANLARGRYAAGNSSTSTFTLGANTAASSLFLDSGNLSTSTRTLTVTNALSLLRGGGNLTLGSATTTLNGGLTLSGSTLTGAAGTLDVNGAVQILTGSLIAPSGSFTVSGNWNKTGGTFTHNSGTVQFDGTTQTLSGSVIFYNLTKTVSNATNLFLAWNSVFSVSGAL